MFKAKRRRRRRMRRRFVFKEKAMNEVGAGRDRASSSCFYRV